jgi:mannose-1-phosphate guanylyltransferase
MSPLNQSTGKHLPACAVILAGGRGTRFWPRSRMRTPKQLLDITSSRTMLRETVERLRPMFSPQHIWVVTNEEQVSAVRRELPDVPRSHILAEPVGRNTAAAIGLASIHLAHDHGDALMAVLPADHYIANASRYRRTVRAALTLANQKEILVVLGIPPTHPETGFGYIERGVLASKPGGFPAYAVRRFTEKPALPEARRYVASGRYYWNAGMFFWRVSTFFENLKEFLPDTDRALAILAAKIGTRSYPAALRKLYPHLENISVDYAIMEPATTLAATRGKTPRVNPAQRVFVLPAEIGWSDIGSWSAVYDLLAVKPEANVCPGRIAEFDASGNFFWSPNKLVAAIGVHNLVVVETPDAILVCHRSRTQDVGKIVQWIEEQKLRHLL